MRDVHGVGVRPGRRARARSPSLLRRSPEQAFEIDVAQFVSTNYRTRTSITSTIMPALGWLAHPAAAAAAQPLVFRSFLALSPVRGSRGHAGDAWFVDLGG